jgi:hypothetical protein
MSPRVQAHVVACVKVKLGSSSEDKLGGQVWMQTSRSQVAASALAFF